MEQDLALVLSPAELAELRAAPDERRLPAVLDGGEVPGQVAPADVEAARRDLSEDPGVRAVLERLWPALTPQRLLAELFADPAALKSAAPCLTGPERDLLLRPSAEPGSAEAEPVQLACLSLRATGTTVGHGDQEHLYGWSVADVPLLDEAAELLGTDDRAARALAARQRAERVAYAQGVLDITAGSRGDDPADEGSTEQLTAADLLDAESLADRHELADHRTVAERAAADRTWMFGHVIVDEAQELSQMAWRLLMRRCPSRSMTIVGDVAQTGTAAGTSSWHRLMEAHVEDRWRLRRLTVNYRTPVEIMAATSELLTALDPAMEPPRSVRRTGERPWRLATTPDGLAGALIERATREAAALREDDGGGRLAVIVPDRRVTELGRAIAAAVPGAVFGDDADLLSPVVVLGVQQVKGLEFDSVLIADPAAIVSASPRGLNDLYVAMTRPTKRLGILHPGPPPAVLANTIH